MDKNKIPHHLIIKDGIQGLGVFAAKDLKKGDIAFFLTGEVISKPTRTSVQIGDYKHIENNIASFMNHNCQANTEVSRDKKAFVCTRDIEKGEELTFNYHQNEDALAAPFTCQCCGKRIIGKKVELV